MYINAASAISAQHSFRQASFLPEANPVQGSRIHCIEPDYSQLIEPKLIRRMSRIIRMGVAAAMDALAQAGLKDPSAILTGTAYGCLEDTGIFLKRLVENKEEMLAPTAFIQSTHNTVGAQIALLLKCHAYNNTYVQRAHSFESALLDTTLFLEENRDAHVLFGAADELTDDSYDILQRFNLFRFLPAGEGAAFFTATFGPVNSSIAQLVGLKTLFTKDTTMVLQSFRNILTEHQLQLNDIDCILSGRTGDPATDHYYDQVENEFRNHRPVLNFKKLCGEYPTASAFALWLAAEVIRSQSIPLQSNLNSDRPIRKVLICNSDNAGYHSFLLLSAC